MTLKGPKSTLKGPPSTIQVYAGRYAKAVNRVDRRVYPKKKISLHTLLERSLVTSDPGATGKFSEIPLEIQ